MTNEELKKKIVEILEETECEWTEEKNGYILQIFYDKLADALIVAGIGDVWEITEKAEKAIVSLIKQNKEAEHRAEVAERAVQILANDSLDYTYDDAMEQAEKELAEEEKE